MLVDIWEGTEPRPEVERFCEMWGIKGPILLDPGAELAGTLGVRGVPTNVAVDSDGTIRGTAHTCISCASCGNSFASIAVAVTRSEA